MTSKGGECLRGVVLFCIIGVIWTSDVVGQSLEQVDYWRARYEELLPQDEPRVERAREIFAEVVQAAGKRAGVVPRLLIIKNDP
jgi:hypothetical protein